jgi:hypothetical protein
MNNQSCIAQLSRPERATLEGLRGLQWQHITDSESKAWMPKVRIRAPKRTGHDDLDRDIALCRKPGLQEQALLMGFEAYTCGLGPQRSLRVS